MASGGGNRYIRQLQQKLRPSQKGVTVDYEIFDYELVHFTHHAVLRMKERGVRRSEVFDALESPDKTGLKTEPDRERYRKKRSRIQAVDVVFERWPTMLCIVTVMVLDI